MPWQTVLWDMGGTLVDTYPTVDRALRDAVVRAGHTVVQDEVARLTRVSIASAIESLAARYGLPRVALQQAYEDLKRSWRGAPPPVMDGAVEVMDAVRAAGGLNIVITHRDRSSASALLAATGLRVDDMICAPDGYARKPDPEMYQVAVDRHGLERASCLSVGDRAIDAEAAAAAGIDAVLLVTPGIPVAAPFPQVHSLRDLLSRLPGRRP